MITIIETKEFDSIYWHDSILMSIEFDVLNNNILLFVDLCISNIENNITYQPCLAIFNYATQFKMKLEWDNVSVQPEIAYIERELVEDPKMFLKEFNYYNYTVHFLDPVNGNIELPTIADFKLLFLSEPIKYENDVDYYQKRLEVIKNYLNNYKK